MCSQDITVYSVSHDITVTIYSVEDSTDQPLEEEEEEEREQSGEGTTEATVAVSIA